MRCSRLCVGLFTLLVFFESAAAVASGRLPVKLLETSAGVELPQDALSSEYLSSLSISIRGRLFDLSLEPSAAVIGASVVMFKRPYLSPVSVRHYQGSVLGVQDSWVRISFNAYGQPEGLVRAGEHLFLVEYDPKLGRLLARDLDNDGAQVFPLSERESVAGAVEPGALKVLPLSIVVDTLYDNAYAGRGLDQALMIVNAVDGIYQEQLGLRLELRTARLLIDTETDPMRKVSTDIDRLLGVFRSYRLGDVAIPRGQGAVHLFSGADLDDRRLGLAYINTICRADGYDVSVSRVVKRGVFTFAHELAHSIGAEHDSHTSCGDNGSMMNATLRPDMQYTFSSCSVASLRAAMGRSCVLEQTGLRFASAGLSADGDEGGSED